MVDWSRRKLDGQNGGRADIKKATDFGISGRLILRTWNIWVLAYKEIELIK